MNFFGKKKDNKEATSTPSKADQLSMSDSKQQAAKDSVKKVEEEIVKVNGHINSDSKGKDIAIPEEKKTKNTS